MFLLDDFPNPYGLCNDLNEVFVCEYKQIYECKKIVKMFTAFNELLEF